MVKKKESLKFANHGFTLIELMIVVAIIGILAAIAMPRFADLITKSKEAAIKGDLGAIRSAISIYYSDKEGLFPGGNLSQALVPTYLAAIPNNRIPSVGAQNNPGHNITNTVVVGVVAAQDGGGWTYSDTIGEVYVRCTHNDTRGISWTAY